MENNKKDFGLALSGGGYRASLFSLGSLWRLNDFGLLSQLDRITSVSGSSITSAYLAMRWKELKFDTNTGIASNFKEIIVEPLQVFCSKGLDVMAVIMGVLSPWKTIGDRVAETYAKRLYKSATLRSIPGPGEGPEFIFYATSFQTGASVQIKRSALYDYKVGELPEPDLTLAKVVGISSAFPPFLSPVTVECDPGKWVKTSYSRLYDQEEYRRKLVLTDGGVYDNLGLEAVWNDGFKNVFVCDASPPLKLKKSPSTNWFGQALRLIDLFTDQNRGLREQTLIDNYKKLDERGHHLVYGGAYWGIKTKINDYALDDAMVRDNTKTGKQQKMRTRLNPFSKSEQGELINWGYALTDAALRKYYFPTPQPPGKWPIPKYALDSTA